MNIVFLGLSLSSSWGNGHATTYRSLLQALHARGHQVLFLEQDQPWYAANRDLPKPAFCQIGYYKNFDELVRRDARRIRTADCVVLGSYVPDGIQIGEWLARQVQGVFAFYDIDTPVTLAQLQDDECRYLAPRLIPEFDLYFSFSGGPILDVLENDFGARRAVPLYCSADPALYAPAAQKTTWSLGYLGTYSADRQPALERLLVRPALSLPKQRFAVMGSQYPAAIAWPKNVERTEHLDPARHPAFYRAQRFTLNITRAAMLRAGYSPSVRLFEAAACGVPVITDEWPGMETFFEPGEEILVARSGGEVEWFLHDLTDSERQRIAIRARNRFLREHTPMHRAVEFEKWVGLALHSSVTPRARQQEVAV